MNSKTQRREACAPFPAIRRPIAGLLAALSISSGLTGTGTGQTYLPYTPDVSTLHLWHLDESAAPAADAAFGNLPLQGLLGGASLSGTAQAGFGTALLANSGTATGGILLAATAVANGSADNVPFSHADPATGAFTYEALIRIASDTALTGSAGLPMEILSMEGDGNADRVFQFRIVGRSATANPKLEFTNLRSGAIATMSATLPTSGSQAANTTDWFHVAVTYSGAEGTADNLRFYWTKLSAGATPASLLGSSTMATDLQQIAADFAIGNEARSTGGQTEGFSGWIDEVRISSIARAADQFIFFSLPPLNVTLHDAGPATDTWETANPPADTLDGNLTTRAAGNLDGAYITYLLGDGSYQVQSIDMAFHNGDVRVYTFDVLVSNDGLIWSAALTGARSGGTSTAPERFVLPGAPVGRFLRVVGHMNSVNTYNSWTEVAINATPVVDSDGDGLPDFWEQRIVDADPGDTVAGIHQVLPGGDFDGDGLTNLSEYLYGTDPAVSNAGDSDGDGLPDLWELSNFGGLALGGFDDPDADGITNLAEQLGGTDPADPVSYPAWKSPRIALLGDSVVAADACLMPSGTYGQAINGISFQDHILLTFEGYQYTAWYDTSGSIQRVCIARRTADGTATGPWEVCKTNSEFSNGDESAWDAHNVVAIGICPNDGTLHIAWDHHGHTLRYRRSVAGLCTTNKGAWISGTLGTGVTMLLAEQNWLSAPGATETSVTYPQFIATPDGNLLLDRRYGSSGDGDQYLHRYTAGAGWSASVQFINRGGTYTGPDYNGNTATSASRCAYLNGMDYGPDGKLHVTWTWREGAGGSNHDICYAYSEDQGITWKNTAGAVVANTASGGFLALNTPGVVIEPLDMRQLLINQQAQCVDHEGRVHILMLHRRQDSGYGPEFFKDDFSTKFTAYYHYFRDPASGSWFQRRIPPLAAYPGTRPKIGFDAAGNLYATFLSYADGLAVTPAYSHGKLVVASASKASSYTDWEVLYRSTTEFNGEPIIDPERLPDDGILSIYIQEHSAAVSSSGIPTALHVLDFAVNVPDPGADTPSLAILGGDAVVCVRGRAGSTYQLQTSPDLSNPWTDVGAPVTGSDHLLAFPHSGGALAPRGFYRVAETR